MMRMRGEGEEDVDEWVDLLICFATADGQGAR